jgi:hypothetical protein
MSGRDEGRMSGSNQGKDRVSPEAEVHDVSELSELDNFTEELERTLAEAGGEREACPVSRPSSVVVPVGKSKRGWGRFFGRGS